ncbi:helix-turn-helix domain-containing protein [Streptomyces sp. NBC_01716]|uniref:helix-turn-helix domain-containing protein n=1 Tax=Streptomyces sp. NBC_01716 TaxID=2975917 RepID=UPI002E30946C|nr:helix-turn-helix transcriptional regulator [Streptomyces sp. NBC_01716]
MNDTADTAAALARHAALLEEASTTGDVDRALRLYAECNQIMKELLKAVVVLCRTKMKTSEVASALHVSVDTVNRHVLAARERATASAPPVVPPPRSRHPERAPRRPLRPAGGTGSADGGPPGRPGVILASALSQLQRTSKKNHKELASEACVDPSYISRILSGERVPSWGVTRRFVVSCGGDPLEVRPLWDTARGYHVVLPTALHAALRGLHLAAAQPPIDLLRARTHLSAADITAALQGDRLPDWPTTTRLVTALQGQPEAIRPLWDAAQATTPAGPDTTITCSISTGAFG